MRFTPHSGYQPPQNQTETKVVYHLLGKTGWSTVEVNGKRQIPNKNFQWDALVPFRRLFPGR